MTDPQKHEGHARHVRTPTSQLHHAEKVKRQERHLQILTVALLLVLLMLGYSAAFDLDNWSEWVVLGGICTVAVGTIIAVHST